jgi:hypothetical protein
VFQYVLHMFTIVPETGKGQGIMYHRSWLDGKNFVSKCDKFFNLENHLWMPSVTDNVLENRAKNSEHVMYEMCFPLWAC